MEEYEDLNDWEVVPDYDISECGKAVQILEEDTKDGSIKSDYFAIDSVGHICLKSEEIDEVRDDSDKLGLVEPFSESGLLETSIGQSNVVGSEYPSSISAVVCSEESLVRTMFLPGDEKLAHLSLGDLPTETASERTDLRCEKFEGESEGNDNLRAQEIMIDVTGGADSATENEKKNFWWKMPWDLLRFYLRVRPVLSVSIAVSMVGIVMLSRKLHRMKRKSRGVPMRISVDDKKVSQLTSSALHLNDAVSTVRRMPIIRPFLSTGGGTQWAALPLP